MKSLNRHGGSARPFRNLILKIVMCDVVNDFATLYLVRDSHYIPYFIWPKITTENGIPETC